MGGTIASSSVDLARGERQTGVLQRKWRELRQGNWHEADEGNRTRYIRRPVDEPTSTGGANIVTARATSAIGILPIDTVRHARDSAGSGSAKMPGRVRHRPLQRSALKPGGLPLE